MAHVDLLIRSEWVPLRREECRSLIRYTRVHVCTGAHHASFLWPEPTVEICLALDPGSRGRKIARTTFNIRGIGYIPPSLPQLHWQERSCRLFLQPTSNDRSNLHLFPTLTLALYVPNTMVAGRLQAPDPPVSYFYSEGTPSLALSGPTSLRVTFGAPLYDGGDRITVFKVQSADFDYLHFQFGQLLPRLGPFRMQSFHRHLWWWLSNSTCAAVRAYLDAKARSFDVEVSQSRLCVFLDGFASVKARQPIPGQGRRRRC